MPALRDHDQPTRPRVRVAASYVDGWRRVLRAPVLALGLLVAATVAGLPGVPAPADAAAALAEPPVATASRVVAHAATGFDGTMIAAARVIGARAVEPAAGYAIVLWLFLWGGALDRLARQRPVGAAAFFGACGVYLIRFTRLALIVAPVYWAVFRWLPGLAVWSRQAGLGASTAVDAALAVLFLAVFGFVTIVADLARVRAVVEDRRSMIGAVAAGVRFLRRRAGGLVGLYVLHAAVLGVLAIAWMLMAPAPDTPDGILLLARGLRLLSIVWTHMALAAAAIAFFQGELAHAGYVAAPPVMWPDSPTVEGLRNLRV